MSMRPSPELRPTVWDALVALAVLLLALGLAFFQWRGGGASGEWTAVVTIDGEEADRFAPADLRPGWGHSTWEQGLEMGRAAGAGLVLMTHYSWDYSDEFLRRQEALAGQDGICRFAKEGMVITL